MVRLIDMQLRAYDHVISASRKQGSGYILALQCVDLPSLSVGFVPSSEICGLNIHVQNWKSTDIYEVVMTIHYNR